MSRRSRGSSSSSEASSSPSKISNRYSSVDMIQNHDPDDPILEDDVMMPLATGGATTTFSGKRRVSLLDSKELHVLQSLLGKSSGIHLDPEKLKPQKVKVSYSNLTPKCFNDPDTEENISVAKKEGKDHYEVFGATPVKLVEKMTLEDFLDNDFLRDFLQSFRTFMDPIDLLHILLLRLQWTQETEDSMSPVHEREMIQKRTLLTLKFWTEQHESDFQNVETVSKIRFHFKLIHSPLLSPENTVLFDDLQDNFGVKGKKTPKKRVSNILTEGNGFGTFTSSINILQCIEGKSSAPAIVSPEEAKVEKVNKQNRPRSSTSRWLSSPLKRESKDHHVTIQITNANGSPNKGVYHTMNPSQATAFLASVSAPNATSSVNGLGASAAPPVTASAQGPSPSQNGVANAATLLLPPSSHMNGMTPPGSPRKVGEVHEGGEVQVIVSSPRRNSRAQSISQKVARLGHETKRKVGNLVGGKEGLDSFNKRLLEQKSSVLAQQLCLIEQRLHKELGIKELAELGWTKKKKGNEARVVMAIINRFNEFSRWVAYAILKGPTPDQRAKMIEKFIRICDKCLTENNLSTVMQIDLALQRQEVFNLKKTWSHVGSYEKDMLRRIREFTTPVRNFKKVREQMEGIQGVPAVPFLGLYLSDMVFNAELPNTTTSDQMINVNKFRNKGNIVRRALKFVSLPSYPFEDDLRLQGKLTLLPFSTESELEKLAKAVD